MLKEVLFILILLLFSGCSIIGKQKEKIGIEQNVSTEVAVQTYTREELAQLEQSYIVELDNAVEVYEPSSNASCATNAEYELLNNTIDTINYSNNVLYTELDPEFQRETECDIFFASYNDEVFSNKKAKKIIVSKSNRVMVLLDKEGNIISRHRVSLGKNSRGTKLKRGDYKTPEGTYHIVQKAKDRKYYKHLSISYPNAKDKKRSKKLGFNPGGGITIHAQVPWNWKGSHDDYTLARNWTQGCIAMTNRGIDMIWSKVFSGIEVEIRE